MLVLDHHACVSRPVRWLLGSLILLAVGGCAHRQVDSTTAVARWQQSRQLVLVTLVPGAGGCIFAHIWKSPDTPTAGCTAMPAAAMQDTLDWLDPREHPIFALLAQAEYARLQQAWHLPPAELQP